MILQGFWHCQCTTYAHRGRWLMPYSYPLQASGTPSWSCFLISLESSRHRGRPVSLPDEGLLVRIPGCLEMFFFPRKQRRGFFWLTRYIAYGRVANLKSESCAKPTRSEGDANHGNLVDHFTALLLAVFFEAGLLKVCFPSYRTAETTTNYNKPLPHQALMALVEDNSDPAIVRKTTLLLGEVLKLASRLLPSTYSAQMQLLPDLFQSATKFGVEGRFAASSAVYQIDSLNRTLHRSLANQTAQHASVDDEKRGQRQVEQVKLKINMTIDEKHFSQLILESGVRGFIFSVLYCCRVALVNCVYRSWPQRATSSGIGNPYTR